MPAEDAATALAGGGLSLALRPPAAALWLAPGCRHNAAAWSLLLATLQQVVDRPGASAAAAAPEAAGPAGRPLTCAEAEPRLRMRLAEAAAASGSAEFALRLLDDEPMLGPDWQDTAAGDDGSPSPLHLLTHLQGAALLAQLGDAGGALNPKPAARPAPENSPADGAAGDALLGSGTAPVAARRLLALMGGLVRPGGAGGSQLGGPAGAQAQAAAGVAAAAVALEPFLGAMPAVVRAAAAHGCLLLARWAQVTLTLASV